VTGGLLILETVFDFRFCLRPAIAFYSSDELNGDPTNWCAPNLPALKAMLRTCGFRHIRLVHKTSVLSQVKYALQWAGKGVSPFKTIQQGRVVVHAWF
jgi:hypothetical protein